MSGCRIVDTSRGPRSTISDVQASLPWARPSTTIEVPEWARDAACRNLTPEEADMLFFPERGHSTLAGRALCARCPVSRQW